jgi:HEAT repeat protein
MRILLHWLWALPVVAAGAGGVWAQAKDDMKAEAQDARIAGKSVDQWVAELKIGKDPSKVENDIRTIMLFGPDAAQKALPQLLAILRKHSNTNPIDTSVRVNATIALGFIFGNSKEPPESKYVQEAVTLLTRMLSDEERIVRYRAAEAIGLIGTEAKSAIPQLIYAIRDPKTFETRQAAAFALGMVAYDKKYGPQPKVLEALYRALKDSATRVRMQAVQSLARLGPPADATLRLGLEKELEPVAKADPDPTVQIWAQMAVMSLNQKTEDWRIAAISKMLSSPDLAARIQAAQALCALGARAKKELPRIQFALNDPDPGVVGWSIMALSRMGKTALPAAEALRKIANDPMQSEALKSSARAALDAIEGRAKDKGIKGTNQ